MAMTALDEVLSRGTLDKILEACPVASRAGLTDFEVMCQAASDESGFSFFSSQASGTRRRLPI
jgi:hypothetical protein